MKISSVAAAIGLAVGYATAQDEVVRTCDAPEPGSQLAAVLEDAAQPEPLDPNAPARIQSGINVETYVHIVTNEADAGNFPPSMVDEQIRVMNERFGPSGFSFDVRNITRTVSAAWGNGIRQGSQIELNMKRALNQGGYDALNIYFLGRTFLGNLGWCYFPQLQPSAIQRDIDGCVNLAASMPGGGATNYEQGITAVHEIGHWIGLFHVFQGSSCTGPGDFVDDTAPQRNATQGCPAVIPNTCPDQPGLDNINNYMDYSFDTCMTEFTPGQINRGTNIFTSLRAGNVRFSPPANLGNAAIQAPQANCAGDFTYMQVRTWPGTEFNVDRCAQHCRETSRYNARHGLPDRCRFFNTYQQTRNGNVEFQACSLYTQAWGADRAINRGQFQGRDRVAITNSVSAFDLDNNGVPDC